MSDWIRETVRRQRAAEARDVARTFGIQPLEEVEQDRPERAPDLTADFTAGRATVGRDPNEEFADQVRSTFERMRSRAYKPPIVNADGSSADPT